MSKCAGNRAAVEGQDSTKGFFRRSGGQEVNLITIAPLHREMCIFEDQLGLSKPYLIIIKRLSNGVRDAP